MSKRVEGDRLVVSDRIGGSVFPTVEAEVPFALECDGTVGDGFRILGSVYGRQVRAHGNGHVQGMLVGRGDVVIDLRNGGRQRYRGGITSSGNIEVLRDPVGVRQSLVGDLKQAQLLVRGDVVGERVVLRNTIVFGNVQARRIVLENCIVFGALIATESMVLRSSTFLYYYSNAVSFEGPCMALHAMGESIERPTFAPLEDHDGLILGSEVAYYPMVRRRSDSALSNRTWLERPAGAASGRLFPSTDWVRLEVETPDVAAILRKRPEEPKARKGERWVLSIAGRAMNFGVLTLDLQVLIRMLQLAFEFDHYLPEAKTAALFWIERHCTTDEQWLMREFLVHPAQQGDVS